MDVAPPPTAVYDHGALDRELTDEYIGVAMEFSDVLDIASSANRRTQMPRTVAKLVPEGEPPTGDVGLGPGQSDAHDLARKAPVSDGGNIYPNPKYSPDARSLSSDPSRLPTL